MVKKNTVILKENMKQVILYMLIFTVSLALDRYFNMLLVKFKTNKNILIYTIYILFLFILIMIITHFTEESVTLV